MSRMTKFLKQKCSYEKALRNPQGEVQLDAYGEVQYEEEKTLKCRREKTIRDVQTPTGAILRSSTRYFFDDGIVAEASDRVDGRPILEVEEYVNQLGKIEGYKCYV